MIDAKTLRHITQNGLQNFATGRILDGIAALRTLLPYCPKETIIRVEEESLEENYHHMLSFIRGGGNDEKRSEVQTKIQQKGILLLEQANRAIRLTLDSDLYCNVRKTVSLEEDILETDEKQDDIFDMLWTSPLWSPQDTAQWYDFILRQRLMVQQHLTGALFLSLWEHYDAEKMQLLNLLADSEYHRTHISAVTYLLLLRIRHKELAAMMPPLPDKVLSHKERGLVVQVQFELLQMLISEKDLEKELREADALTKELTKNLSQSGLKDESLKAAAFKGDITGSLQSIISLRGRYLKHRIQRGLDINLSKIPLLHSCQYLHRVSHWFLPFDKTHPLFQSVMIDDKGNEKQNLSMLVDLIMDCDVDKLAMLYLVAHDKDFSNAVRQLDEHGIPDINNATVPEYTVRFIMQDLYRFFGHSPLSSQLHNPFRTTVTLLDFPELAHLFSLEDCIACCRSLIELGRDKQALAALNSAINREGANAEALLLKGRILKGQKKYAEAISLGRNAELLEPDNTDILQFLVECYAGENRFEEELEYLQKLADLQPDDKRIRRLIPITLNKLGRDEEALALFFKLDYESTEDDDDYATILSCIADTALSLGKLDIAERYTQKTLELYDGKEEDALLRMGHIKLLQGDTKSAIGWYEQFINYYCQVHNTEAAVALSPFDKSMEMLVAKDIKREDLLLIRDILQAASEKNNLE